MTGTEFGAIYKVTPAGVVPDVYDFTGANGDEYPGYPPIQASDGNLYGTLELCSTFGNRGCIYKITPTGHNQGRKRQQHDQLYGELTAS